MAGKKDFFEKIQKNLQTGARIDFKNAGTRELHKALAKACMEEIMPLWNETSKRREEGRRAFYLSAEFLMGRAVYNNLYCLGMLEEAREMFAENGADINAFEDIEDAALGNGGLGRLAACFLDSAAAHDIPLDGYGIRYRYGLFKQSIRDGFQHEEADKWLDGDNDPWGVRCERDAVKIEFADQTVMAVPYDTPIIGYGKKAVNTLRLWQAEPISEFSFEDFDRQDYMKASEEAVKARAISDVLYPNDNYEEGRRLRLKQQYFFSAAALKDIIRKHKAKYGNDFSNFSKLYTIQLNDTHPTVAIPELIRIFMFEEGMHFEDAFKITCETFNYTNHTVMGEALEKWDIRLFKSVLPTIYEIIGLIDRHLRDFIKAKEKEELLPKIEIIDGARIHMARMAVYCTSFTNGVAALHTEILKNDVFKEWYSIFPERFQNKTNGITQRRWLGLCNPELSSIITEKLGSDAWALELGELKRLEWFADEEATLNAFNAVKYEKKKQLCDYIEKHEGIKLNPDFIFDVQVKRLHEYKRQLLNAFSIVDIYFALKEGRLNDFTPTAFIFGAKAAPAYRRAKGIIKYINEIAKLVNNDPDTKNKLAVIFVQNYNVSYAEKIIPAADISEQISTAGLEASGTGNMKFMLNGAVTLGTLDGANIEIAEEAGAANEYIFGATVEEINAIKASYNPKKIFMENKRINRVVSTLVDGTFNDGDTGMFYDLFKSLIDGFSWHRPDNYFILKDFESYMDAKLRANREYRDRKAFAKKCWMNIANAGKFSSDRTVKEYAKELWKV
ncbi:MAG TPA: glycogen/starch/alpha-glucan phosphorylase [Oscillospiraceae bacterium]|nr:glycogen/starch/alpha-glucan phosphorylase [Oscillospiraceae bacterium]